MTGARCSPASTGKVITEEEIETALAAVIRKTRLLRVHLHCSKPRRLSLACGIAAATRCSTFSWRRSAAPMHPARRTVVGGFATT